MTTKTTGKMGKTLLVLAVGGVALYGTARLVGGVTGWMWGDEGETAGAEHLRNQIWIDHMPEHRRDIVGHLAFVDHPEGRIGGVGRSSTWRHRLELFMWDQQGSSVMLRFPQNGARGKVKVRTWRCEGEAPEPFELCLELSDGERSRTMYSREDWVIKPQEIEASLDAVAHEVPALTGTFDTLDPATLLGDGNEGDDDDDDDDGRAEPAPDGGAGALLF